MYVGLLLALVAWGILLSNYFSIALAATFILYMNRFQIQQEESALESKFGNDYLAYKRRVRRWL
jgi:protein-S-isoprenylcysteine O-methyltransferase Ste14